MKPELKEGLFITFEGGEGAGKSTLMEKIANELGAEGFLVLKTREPGGTKLGEQVRELLLQGEVHSPHAELCLYLASRAEQIIDVIKPALLAKKIVLCDRFNDSSIVYQGVARGLGKEETARICHFISQGLEPHLTLYFDIDPKLGLSRATRNRKPDRIESEGEGFHQKIREGYLTISKENPKRFRLLDASRSIPLVFEDAMKSIHELLSSAHV